MKAVLPSSVGGDEANVVLYDNDLKFDAERAAELIGAKLRLLMLEYTQRDATMIDEAQLQAELAKIDVDVIVAQCLSRIHVFRLLLYGIIFHCGWG
jgi:hypothetical protein